MARTGRLETLVAGGAGFIGSALIRALLRGPESRHITVVGRSSRPRTPLPDGVSYYSGDVANSEFIQPLVEKADEIIDLAYGTVPKTSFDDPLIDVVSNLPASVNLQKLACQSRVKRYLLVSSGGAVYGNTEASSIDESHPTNPISPYGISKLVTEKYGMFFCRMEGLPLVVARPGNPYGIGQIGQKLQGFVGAAMQAAIDSSAIDVYGERGTVRDYIYIDELAQALIAALQCGVPGSVFNIGTGVGNDNIEVLEALRNIVAPSGLTVKARRCPSRPFDVNLSVLDSRRLTEVSGWRPTISLTEGIDRLWSEWMMTQELN
jgi:UDP-glucose 4-epimerase